MGKVHGRTRLVAAQVDIGDLAPLIDKLKYCLDRPHVETVIIQNDPHPDIHLTRSEARSIMEALKKRWYAEMN